METMSRAPRHPALVGLVASLWVSARSSADDHETILPSGRAQVVIDGDRGGSLLVGPHTRPSVIRPSRFAAGMSLSGVGLHALCRAPMRELLDEVEFAMEGCFQHVKLPVRQPEDGRDQRRDWGHRLGHGCILVEQKGRP